MDYNEEKISRITLFKGKIIDVFLDKVKLSNGHIVDREVVRHSDGVAVLAINDGFCYLVRQFRYPNNRVFLEIPAGIIEDGEDSLAAAKRELLEETGICASEFNFLGQYYVSPGISNESVYLYLATGLRFKKQFLDDNEILNVEKVELSKILNEIDNNSIDDAKTVIAFLKARQLF